MMMMMMMVMVVMMMMMMMMMMTFMMMIMISCGTQQKSNGLMYMELITFKNTAAHPCMFFANFALDELVCFSEAWGLA